MAIIPFVSRLSNILAPSRRVGAARIVALTAIAAGLEAMSIGMMYPFLQAAGDPAAPIPEFLHGFGRAFGIDVASNGALFLGFVTLFLILSAAAMNAFTTFLQVRFTWSLNDEISKKLFEHVLSKPYASFFSQNRSELAKEILEESHRLTTGVIDPLLTIIARTMAVLGIFLVLILAAPGPAMLAFLVAGSAYLGVYRVVQRRLQTAGAGMVEANSHRYIIVNESLRGIKDIKIRNMELQAASAYTGPSARFSQEYTTLHLARRIPPFIIQGLAFGGGVALILILMASGNSLGTIVPLIGLLGFAMIRLLPHIQQIAAAFVSCRFNGSLLENISSHIGPGNVKLEDHPSTDGPPLTTPPSIALEDLVFAYDDATILKEISLLIPKASTVAVVGPTGAGKTTLVDVIAGLLTPTSGAVLIDGHPVRPPEMRKIRASFGYVPQDVHLLDDSIASNIAYGVPVDRINHEALTRAATIAQIHETILSLPDGYNTRVGDDGVRLSGGQRQRLGIARALYHDPQVVILDEATSSVDSRTENAISSAIAELHGTKTLIVITHRLATIQYVDTIHFLVDGTLRASGSFEDLVVQEPDFAELVVAGSGGAESSVVAAVPLELR